MNWKHLDKSYVLFAMASSRCRYEQCIFLKKGPNGPYIQIPSRIGPPPQASSAFCCRLLGGKNELSQFGSADICKSCSLRQTHATPPAQAAPFTMHSIETPPSAMAVLHHCHIALWFACRQPDTTYHPAILHFGNVNVSQDHSFRTRHTHDQVLLTHSLEHPIQLLLCHAEQCASTCSLRLRHLPAGDILHGLDWTTLQHNIQLISAACTARSQVPHSPAAIDEAELCLSDLPSSV